MFGKVHCDTELLELIDRLPSILIVFLVDDSLEDLKFVVLLALNFTGLAVPFADVGAFEGFFGGHLIEAGFCLAGWRGGGDVHCRNDVFEALRGKYELPCR